MALCERHVYYEISSKHHSSVDELNVKIFGLFYFVSSFFF